MKIVKQSWEFEVKPNWTEMLVLIESAGRTCYKTEQEPSIEDVKAFVKKMIDSGHHSVIEHANISVRIITDRGVTHELVRHRLASYSQESTRYCNYSRDKFGGEVKYIQPTFKLMPEDEWLLEQIESHYLLAVKTKRLSPQEARYFLPNGLKTEIVVTANVREWRHIFTLRCSTKAHPQMRELMLDMLTEFRNVIPVLFDDIEYMGRGKDE
jgi:thymidylate synthase (FAD)